MNKTVELNKENIIKSFEILGLNISNPFLSKGLNNDLSEEDKKKAKPAPDSENEHAELEEEDKKKKKEDEVETEEDKNKQEEKPKFDFSSLKKALEEDLGKQKTEIENLVKGLEDSLKEELNKIQNEFNKKFTALGTIEKAIHDDLEKISTPIMRERRSITNIDQLRERNFETKKDLNKGNNEENLQKGLEGKQVYRRADRKAVLTLLQEKANFDGTNLKGANQTFLNALQEFEASNQISKAAANELAKENIVIIG